MTDWSAYPNFSRAEFECRCGCGQADMDDDFMTRLQTLRTFLGFPFPINSGYRCTEHNRSVGGGAAHVAGKASDIGCFGSKARQIVVSAEDFPGIGVNQKGDPSRRFIHLDTLTSRDAPRPTLWDY